MDSGGYTELVLFGHWNIDLGTYVAAVGRYAEEIGNLDWAVPMDWPCSPAALARTGLDVGEHQRRTIDNFLRLREQAPELPFVPVLQGWTPDEYLRCLDRYSAGGIDLTRYHTVALGSVAQRQATDQIATLVTVLSHVELNLHVLGLKPTGVRRYAGRIRSGDSLSWSWKGRWVARCSPTHETEANCLRFALEWRAGLLALADTPDPSDHADRSATRACSP